MGTAFVWNSSTLIAITLSPYLHSESSFLKRSVYISVPLQCLFMIWFPDHSLAKVSIFDMSCFAEYLRNPNSIARPDWANTSSTSKLSTLLLHPCTTPIYVKGRTESNKELSWCRAFRHKLTCSWKVSVDGRPGGPVQLSSNSFHLPLSPAAKYAITDSFNGHHQSSQSHCLAAENHKLA